MKTILLKFSGPLQSWGTDSNFENRYTDKYPSKSAVIGMIAASFGYRRDESELIDKLNKINFGVRIDQPGSLLRDYHIATKYKKNGDIDRSYVTNRYYVQDAVFVVGISSDDEMLMESISHAIKNPYFSTFLGRRSLPLNPDFYIKITDMPLIEALKTEKIHTSSWYEKKILKDKSASKYLNMEIYADAHLIENSFSFMKRDKFKSFSQKRRKHDFRAVSKIIIQKRFDNEDVHDVFSNIGGSNVYI